MSAALPVLSKLSHSIELTNGDRTIAISRDTVIDLFQVGPLQLNICKMLTWQGRQAVQH